MALHTGSGQCLGGVETAWLSLVDDAFAVQANGRTQQKRASAAHASQIEPGLDASVAYLPGTDHFGGRTAHESPFQCWQPASPGGPRSPATLHQAFCASLQDGIES